MSERFAIAPTADELKHVWQAYGIDSEDIRQTLQAMAPGEIKSESPLSMAIGLILGMRIMEARTLKLGDSMAIRTQLDSLLDRCVFVDPNDDGLARDCLRMLPGVVIQQRTRIWDLEAAAKQVLAKVEVWERFDATGALRTAIAGIKVVLEGKWLAR